MLNESELSAARAGRGWSWSSPTSGVLQGVGSVMRCLSPVGRHTNITRLAANASIQPGIARDSSVRWNRSWTTRVVGLAAPPYMRLARPPVPVPEPGGSSNVPFPTTRWSQVVVAVGCDDGTARLALAELCAAYWYPLYAFVRRKGHSPDAAADLVQGTFVNLLDRNCLARVGPDRGRFRSFLMAACTHHLADRRDCEQAAKRGGGFVPIPFDRLDAEGRYAIEPVDELTAERLFERRWAISLLDRAVSRLEAESLASGKADLVSELLPTLTGGRGDVSHAAIAAKLGMTDAAVKMAASRLRKRYGVILREEIARTVDDPSDVESEIRALFAALAR